jgi:hypothetical protein
MPVLVLTKRINSRGLSAGWKEAKVPWLGCNLNGGMTRQKGIVGVYMMIRFMKSSESLSGTVRLTVEETVSSVSISRNLQSL